MVAIELPPGVYAAPTKASRSAQWSETNLMRWKEGKLNPFGGWEKYAYATPLSRIRAIHRWNDLEGKEWKAFLCEGHIYVEKDGDLFDISPTVALVPPYSNVLAGGYGTFTYNLDNYGDPRPNRNREIAITPVYTLDNWGEDLLIMTSTDGRLLRWKPSTPTVVAAVVPNAPLANRTFTVTAERHVVLYGMGGIPNQFGWCDEEDIEDWNFATVASKAGKYLVEPASPIVSARRTRGGIIFHTARKAYIINHIGLPFVYNYDELTDGGTPISGASIVDTAGGTFWPSASGFWTFNGTSVQPVPCPVWNWISNDVDQVYTRYEGCAVDITTRNEIWFFFVGKGERYNTRYVVYNYVERWWAMGKMARSCGYSPSYTAYPMLSDGFSVYKHESGDFYPGSPEAPWAETFAINMGGGAGISTITQMVPDIGGEADTVSFKLYYSIQRSTNSNQVAEKVSAAKKMRADGWVDFRSTGRDFRLRIESDATKRSRWTFGNTEFTIKARGGR